MILNRIVTANFVRGFATVLMEGTGIQLNRHSQMDGVSAIMNRMVEELPEIAVFISSR